MSCWFSHRVVVGSSLWLVAPLAFAVVVAGVRGEDWPQWQGPQRDAVWRETGILDKFPEGGPKVLWRAPLQGGYSGPAVAGDRVYVTDFQTDGERKNDPGARPELTGTERVHCLDAKTGQTIWMHVYACTYRISYPAGPRTTPTVQGGKVYTLGAEGDLVCLDATDGKLIWKRNLPAEYKAETPVWGYSSHILIDGDKLFTLAGGKGSVVVALDKNTGKEIWRALDNNEIGYCPPSIQEAGGKRQLIIWHPKAINGLDLETGKVYWTEKLEPQYGMSIQIPVRFQDLLYAGGIGNQALAVKLAADQPTASEAWRGTNQTAVYSPCGAPFVDEQGVLYGACQQGHFRAVDIKTGKRLWESFKPTTGTRFASSGTCFIVKNGDRYFLMSENGDLIIAKLSAAGYEEVSRTHLIDATNEAFGRPVVWTHPAFAHRNIYMRNDKEIICASLAK